MSFSKKDRYGIFLGAGVITIAVMASIVVGILKYKETSQPGYDEVTLCPVKDKYPHVVMLLDKTDPYSVTQKQAILALVHQKKKELRKFEKLSIFVLDDKNYLAPHPRFAICNPGSRDDANPLYENPRQIQKYYNDRFGVPLEHELADLVEGVSSRLSPIIEMVHAVSLLHDFGADIPERQLIIVSDLMQNMPEFSHFSNNYEYANYRNTPYAKRLRANLTGAKIKLVYLLRPELYKHHSQPNHQNFWGQMFDDAGAKSIEFQRVP